MKPSKGEIQMAELSAFVHGLLAGLHILGIAYNAKRKNWFDVAAHTAAAAYDLTAVRHHMQDVHKLEGCPRCGGVSPDTRAIECQVCGSLD